MSHVRNAPERCFSDLNGRIAALARKQGGHVTAAQLRALGLGRGGGAVTDGAGLAGPLAVALGPGPALIAMCGAAVLLNPLVLLVRDVRMLTRVSE